MLKSLFVRIFEYPSPPFPTIGILSNHRIFQTGGGGGLRCCCSHSAPPHTPQLKPDGFEPCPFKKKCCPVFEKGQQVSLACLQHPFKVFSIGPHCGQQKNLLCQNGNILLWDNSLVNGITLAQRVAEKGESHRRYNSVESKAVVTHMHSAHLSHLLHLTVAGKEKNHKRN